MYVYARNCKEIYHRKPSIFVETYIMIHENYVDATWIVDITDMLNPFSQNFNFNFACNMWCGLKLI